MALTRWLGALVAGLALGAASLAASQPPARVALVIGNAGYQHVAPLANPGNDAHAITRKLEALGFAVTPAVDFGIARTRAAIEDFARASTGADIALVFYAGHGLQLAGENYLIPVDATIRAAADLAQASFRVSEIRAAADGAQPRVFVLILDACRNNPFPDAVPGTAGLARGGAIASAGPGPEDILVAFAAGPGAVAKDGTDGNSPFTTALLQWIDRPQLELVELFRRVQGTVAVLSGGTQIPYLEQAVLRPDIVLNRATPAGAAPVTFEDALLGSIRGMPDAAERRAALAYFVRLFPDRADVVAELEAEPDADDAGSGQAFLEANLVWLSIKDSTDPAVLDAFAGQFPDSGFADLALGRRDALLAAAAAPEPEPVVVAAPAPEPTATPAVETPPATQAGPAPAVVAATPEPPVAPAVETEPVADRAPVVVAIAPERPAPEAIEAVLGLDDGELAAVQRLLAAAGHYRGRIDGAIGPMSRSAVAAFQSGAGQPATGFLDQATLYGLVVQAAAPALSGDLGDEDRAALQRLAAVARRGAGAEPVVVRVEAIAPAPDIEANLREEARRFEADHPDTVIEFRLQPDPDYKAGLLLALGSGEPPDVFYTWGGGHLRAIAEAGFARDLTGALAADGATRFKPGAIENVTVDGRIFAVPQEMTLVSLWVNEPVLRQAGVDPAGLGTWQGFLDAVRTLRAAGVVPLAVGGGSRWPLQFFWGALAEAVGGRATLDRALAGGGAGFNDPAFVRAGVLLDDLVALDPFQPGFGDATAIDSVDTFAGGEAAMMLSGNWTLPRTLRRWPGGPERAAEEIGRVDFPPADLAPGDNPTYGGTPAWVVAADAPDEAVAFVRAITGLDAQARAARKGLAIPSIAGADAALAGPLQRDVASELTRSTHHQLFYDQVLGPQAGESLNYAVVALVEGDLTPEQTAAEIQSAWQRVRGYLYPDAPVPAPAPARVE